MLLVKHQFAPEYRSRFKDWDTRASVRTKPLRSMPADEHVGKLFFSPEMVPIALHSLVADRGPEAVHRALVYHLLTHLDFTDTLENEVVAPVAYGLGRQELGFALPSEMRSDARKIAVDEMHHALFATALIRSIETAAGVQALAPRRPAFLRELDEIQACAPPELRPLLLFFFAVVSETLITGTLSRVPVDDRVVPTVRHILRDHAEDEARHHAYFSEALAVAWPQLTERHRAIVGPLLPRFILMFLTPDFLAIQDSLAAIGLSAQEAERVIDEAHDEQKVAAEVWRSAEPTLRHLRRAGVFEHALTADAFAACGLRGERCEWSTDLTADPVMLASRLRP